jgi:hypothetical protein
LVVWEARNSPDGLLHGGGSSVEGLIGASPCKTVRCPTRGLRRSMETRGNSGMGCRGWAWPEVIGDGEASLLAAAAARVLQ